MMTSVDGGQVTSDRDPREYFRINLTLSIRIQQESDQTEAQSPFLSGRDASPARRREVGSHATIRRTTIPPDRKGWWSFFSLDTGSPF
ncbi:hypothetical protein W02_08780 [Nitrospira sp. KM1]|uniref:hypothetical protein n=1 Tax=Nitrospira sp. KM1 TaxID=1936990 RepID=UPI0013A7A307|nr:hypothetical protein [Nitrospira sp. KM1]BCA53738.1 hypothetical protein W02_08780 [Nitrospira sp. KM1]